jgi:hypothetical protein
MHVHPISIRNFCLPQLKRQKLQAVASHIPWANGAGDKRQLRQEEEFTIVHSVSIMEIHITPESLAALQADSPVRCLYREKFSLDSRLPQPVKTWVDGLVETVHRTLLKSVGRDTATSNKEVLMIQVRRKHVLICFDIFLEDCNSTTARRMLL